MMVVACGPEVPSGRTKIIWLIADHYSSKYLHASPRIQQKCDSSFQGQNFCGFLFLGAFSGGLGGKLVSAWCCETVC